MATTPASTLPAPLPDAAEQPGTSDLEPIIQAERDLRLVPAPDQVGPPSEAGKRIGRNLGALFGGQAITWTVTLIWTLIVPRALGPAGLGILVSAQSVSGVLGIILGVGTQNYLVRETVVDPAAGPRLVGTVFVLRLALAPVVGLAALAWAHLAHYDHNSAIVLYLITAMTVFTLLLEPLQAAFQATERMKYIAYGNVINKVAQSLVGIGLVFAGFRVVGIAADMAITACVVVLVSWWWLRPYFRIDVRTNATMMLRVTKDSLAYWLFGLFGLFYLWIDTIMLTLMTRSAVVGWYGASTQMFQTLMFLPVLVQTAWLPRLVAAFGKGQRDLEEAARTPVELALMLSMPIAAGTLVVANVLIHAVYGPGFAHAVPVLIVLGLCVPPLYLNIVLASVLVAAKRQVVWTKVMIGAAVFNPLLNLVLISVTQHRYHNGAIGAAISLVVTEVLMDGIGVMLVARHVFERRMVTRCALMFLASAAAVAVTQLARPLGAAASLMAGFATLAIVGGLLPIVRREELALLRSAIAQVRGRSAETS